MTSQTKKRYIKIEILNKQLTQDDPVGGGVKLDLAALGSRPSIDPRAEPSGEPAKVVTEPGVRVRGEAVVGGLALVVVVLETGALVQEGGGIDLQKVIFVVGVITWRENKGQSDQQPVKTSVLASKSWFGSVAKVFLNASRSW